VVRHDVRESPRGRLPAEQHQGSEVHIPTIGVMALAFSLSLAACKRAPAPTLPAPPPIARSQNAVDVSAKREPADEPADPLCHGRLRCSIMHRLSAGSPETGRIVVARIAASPNAASDEDRCDRREYWLARPEGDLLLAVDCAEQWGADNAGPAEVMVSGTLAKFHYVEFLADDRCEIVDAALRLPQGRIEAHARQWGKVVGNLCRPTRKRAPIPEAGSGTIDHPILVLHRP
jgi:hypothetical protein